VYLLGLRQNLDILYRYRKILRLKLEEEGKWRILRIFEDRGKSARDLNRPELEELLDFCR